LGEAQFGASREGLVLLCREEVVSVPGLPREILDVGLVVAIDPGKVTHRVWVTDRGGIVGEPVSLPSSRAGLDRLEALVGSAPATFAIEATGALHRAWVTELEHRRPGSLRLFAPSETVAARAQLGSRRFKTDDRDCAALVWLAPGRRVAGEQPRRRRDAGCGVAPAPARPGP
jgi:transposase